MKKFLVVIALFAISSFKTVYADEGESRMVIHLLDYVATDYGNAVEEGEVINAFEYREMAEFAKSIHRLLEEQDIKAGAKTNLLLKAVELDSLIGLKVNPDKIKSLAQGMKAELIEAAEIEVAPYKWPDLSAGAKLYARHCAACHGAEGKGDGINATGLDPQPTQFSNYAVMAEKSPLQAFHTIRFGVEGTSMVAFNDLNDRQVWDLAFYIQTLKEAKGQAEAVESAISLSDLSSKSDLELLAELNPEKGRETVNWWRNFQVEQNYQSLNLAEEKLNEALILARKGDFEEGRKACLQAYLEGIEPIEVSLKAENPALVQDIELSIGSLRSKFENEASVSEIETGVEEALALITEAREVMEEKESSYWLSFSLAASVVLREGLEAFLIIIIMLSILRKAKANKAIKWLHGGWITALLSGVVGWFFADKLLNFGGASRELMEGIIALFAVCILLYIGFWMHSKSNARKWNEYVKQRIDKMLSRESMFGLAVFSFIVVFREVFESILFLSAIRLEEGADYRSAVGFGVLAALGLVAIIGLLMLRFSKRIPIPQLFKFSSIVISILAIILVGKGIHAIQESGYFSITEFPINLRLGLLGLYPTIETVLAQISLAGALLLVWIFRFRSQRKVLKAA